jgi:hypothetical protein
MKFPTDLLKKLFPTPAKDKDGHCVFHIDDRFKCPNFKPVKGTHNCCEFLLITGECEAE